ncbi:MAG: MFS transporter [Endomicrobiales bacterium]|nr:MFS transporter [Endomicrobiales bacterium]
MKDSIFKSFRHRNYQFFYAGQFISVVGIWLQMVATPWLVYRLTGSAFLLGFISFVTQIFVLFSPFTGAIADHIDKRKALIVIEFFAMLQALLLGVLVYSGTVQMWHIFAISTFLGVVAAFDMPFRQAFLMEIVPKNDLMNAIGLNGMLFNSARLVGPAIGGLLISKFGEGLCFVLNGVTYIAAIIALYYIVPARVHDDSREISIVEKFREGISYVKGTPHISSILLLLSVTGLVGVFPVTLMPIFAKDIYGLGAKGFGMFMAALGTGAVLATFQIASRKTTEGLPKVIYAGAWGIAACMSVFALVRNVPFALLTLAVAGYAMVIQLGFSNTLIQMTSPEKMRGRIMGFFVMAFMGFMPVGSLVAGSLAHYISAPLTIALGGFSLGLSAIILKKRILNHA